ncbi:centriolar coiled-coil protein of 110 kDa-like [Lampetra planeri]
MLRVAVFQANLLDVQKRSNRVSAVVKGFLTRRLLRTEKVQRLVRVIKDTRQLALSIQGDSSTKCLGPSDSAFRTRLLKQIQGALDEIHNIFFVLSPGQRMVILKTDKEVQQAKGLRTAEKGMVTHGTKSVSSRPLKLKLHHT